MRRLLIAVVLAATLVALAVEAQDTVIRGRSRGFVYINALDPTTTDTNVQSTVAGMLTSFTRRGRGPVIATFCAETEVLGTMLVGVRIDGILMTPGEVSLDENFTTTIPSDLQSHCHIWAQDNVAPGGHNIDVVWRKLGTPPGSGIARMNFRSLKVEF